MNPKHLLLPIALVLLGLTMGCAKETPKAKAAKPVKVKAVETHASANHVRYSASIRPAAGETLFA